MKFNGRFAACAAAVVAILSSASAFAADGVLAKFFGGQELTLGEMPTVARYATSEVDGLYSGECAGCAASAASETPIFDAGVIDYGYVAPGYVYDDFGFGGSYVYDDFWAPRRPFTPVRRAVRPVANLLRGVRNFLCRGGYNYCQPAYVCDPCWSVCDPCWSPCVDVCDPCGFSVCDPCAAPVCDPCAPLSVYAPSGCCGYGVAPGELRELDPKTGVAVNRGVDDGDTPATTTSPSVISTEPEQEPASRPATTQPATTTPTFSDPSGIMSTGEGETVPTPPADNKLGVGVIRMLVPEDSVVFVNGYRTKQKGALRSFAAKNLEVGETYSFEIRVVENRDGKRYEDVQTTTLTAGDTTALAFNLTLSSDEAYAINAR